VEFDPKVSNNAKQNFGEHACRSNVRRGFPRVEWDFGLLFGMDQRSGCCARPAGGWLARAAIAVAVLLGAIEVIQIHLPGRVAEITDPLLALLLAITLGLLDRSESVRSNLSSTKVRTYDLELP